MVSRPGILVQIAQEPGGDHLAEQVLRVLLGLFRHPTLSVRRSALNATTRIAPALFKIPMTAEDLHTLVHDILRWTWHAALTEELESVVPNLLELWDAALASAPLESIVDAAEKLWTGWTTLACTPLGQYFEKSLLVAPVAPCARAAKPYAVRFSADPRRQH